MLSIRPNIRGLDRRIKRFFKSYKVKEIKALTDLRIVLPFVELFHRIEIKETGYGGIDCSSVGSKIAFKVPIGEIWVVEAMKSMIDVGIDHRFESIGVWKGVGMQFVIASFEDTLEFELYRGVDYSDGMAWLYSGDELIVNVSIEAPAAKSRVYLLVRRIDVGDDF
ncbi:hypothetical protein ES705_38392 [subsurface metagenome]